MADESTRRCQGRAAGANANCPSTMEGGALPEPLSLPSAPPPTCGRPRPVSSTSARNPTNSTSEKRNWRGHVPVDRPTALQTLGSCLTAYVPGFSDGQAHGRRAKVRCGRGALPARNPNPWGGGPLGMGQVQHRGRSNLEPERRLSRDLRRKRPPKQNTHTHTRNVKRVIKPTQARAAWDLTSLVELIRSNTPIM